MIKAVDYKAPIIDAASTIKTASTQLSAPVAHVRTRDAGDGPIPAKSVQNDDDECLIK